MTVYILVFIIVIFLYIFIFVNRKNIVLIESKTGTKLYVYNDSNKKEKIKLLGDIIKNLFILKHHMINNIDSFPEYKVYIKQLDRNLNDKNTIINETDPNSDLTSYSVNKGEELSFCLKSKKTGKIHDINLMMYVAIHELAHIANPEIGHGELFKKIFRKLLEEAVKLNIYKIDNYSANPVEYCGMILSSTIL
jgi:predicted metal-dependent hydrolase